MLTRIMAPLFLAATLFPTAMQAAEPAPPANPADVFATENMSVNETIGDWSVRCFMVESIAPCDVLQLASQQETNRRVLLISIAYVPARDSYAMQMIVPLGVMLARGMTLGTGANALNNVKFSRCLRDGCYVESPLAADVVDMLATSAEPMTSISLIAYPSNEPVNLPVSLNGFADAIARMRDEAQARAAPEPPAPAQ